MDIALSGKLFSQRETILPIHFHILKKAVTLIGVERVERNLQWLLSTLIIVTF
jgi:hypothetical protein